MLTGLTGGCAVENMTRFSPRRQPCDHPHIPTAWMMGCRHSRHAIFVQGGLFRASQASMCSVLLDQVLAPGGHRRRDLSIAPGLD